MKRPTLLLACLAAALLTPAHAIDVVTPPLAMASPEAYRQLRRGNDALQARRFDAAEAAFREASRLAPFDPSPWMGLASLAHKRGQEVAARDAMQRAVALAPDRPKVLQAQALLLFALRDHAAAEKAYRALLALEPEHFEHRVRLAAALGAQGRSREAQPLLDELARGRRLSSDQWIAIGEGYVALRAAAPALQSFERALALAPEAARAHAGRGEALALGGRQAAALGAFERALRLQKPTAGLQTRRAIVLDKLGRDHDAENAYRDALKLDAEHVVALNNLADLLARRALKLDEALQLAQRAVALEKTEVTYDTLGSVHLARGELVQARAALQQALALAPGDTRHRERLAQAQPRLARQPGEPLPLVADTGSLSTSAGADIVALAPAAAGRPSAAAADSGPTHADGDRHAVLERLTQWAGAWQGKDAVRYLGFYAASFEPDRGRSRAAWESDRRAKLGKAGSISIEIAAPKVDVQGDRLAVTFRQQYRAADFADTTRKRIEWVREGGEWRIRREQTL